MLRFVLLASLLAACSIGGGPVITFHAAHPQVAWQAGPGLFVAKDKLGGTAQLNFGRAHGAWTEATDGAFFRVLNNDASNPVGLVGGGLSFRFGEGDFTSAGFGTAGAIAWSSMCSNRPSAIATLSIGIRSDATFYLAPRLDVTYIPPIACND